MPSTQAEKNRNIRERNKDFKDRQRVKSKLQTIIGKIQDLQGKEWEHISTGENAHLDNMRSILATMFQSRDGGK